MLDDAHEIGFLVFSVYYHLGYLRSELFVLLTRLREIGDVIPQFAAVLEVDQELSNIRVWAFQGVAEDLTRTIELQLDVDWGITAFSKWYCL